MITFLRSFVTVVARLVASREALVAENLLLRHQLAILHRSVKRPRFSRWDRWLLSSLIGHSKSLLEAIVIVRPATILGWHRAGWRLWWRHRSRRPIGRPPIDADLRALIRRLWQENPL
jgi:hypothetical protein